MTEIIGWLSSALLVLTIGKQIHSQWTKGTSKGVSIFLFIGQLAASTGFTIYSVMTKNPVFIVTNSLMMIAAILGLAIVIAHRMRESRGSGREEAAERSSEDDLSRYAVAPSALARR